MGVFDRVFTLVCSLACLAAGVVISSAHPVTPSLAVSLFCGAFAVSLWRPSVGMLAIPVLLPLLNFSPWSGWLIVDEFDLLILSVLAAGYVRMTLDGREIRDRRVYFTLLAVVGFFVARDFCQLSVRDLNGFADFSMPLNSFRVGKSLLWTALLFPLFTSDNGDTSGNNSVSRFFRACVVGSGIVVLAVIWERGFYPGLLDFSTPYRTVALFWEMHLGGAALDVYLVLIAPMLVWVWRSTHTFASRLALGAFVLVFAYSCLTTYSRGVIASILGSLLLLVAVLTYLRLKCRQAPRIFSMTGGLVVALVFLEVALVVGADTYLNERLAASDRDLGGRIQHWERGIRTLKTPKEWLFGIGLGKLPVRLTQGEMRLPLSGRFYLKEVSDRQTMALAGPDSYGGLLPGDGFYFLSQRVDLSGRYGYRFAADVFSDHNADLLVKVCAVHLLYPARCRDRIIRFDSSGWQHKATDLLRPLFETGYWQGAGHGVLLLSVLTPGATVELGHVYLTNGPSNLLRNEQFLDGVAGWFPVARFYFMPWHIDNLYLEILIETGLFGLLGFLAVVVTITRHCIRACRCGNAFAPYFLTCITGLMALGLVVSVLDMPRVAILFGLVLLGAWQSSRSCSTRPDLATVEGIAER